MLKVSCLQTENHFSLYVELMCIFRQQMKTVSLLFV